MKASTRILITLVLLGIAASVGAQSREEFVRPDTFGYQVDAACPMQFTDIAVSGTPIPLTDTDDGAGSTILLESFPFYGVDRTDIVVASNGYLAFANGTTDEAGTDFSNDCALPAVPDQGPAIPARIMLLHDDLEAVDGNSTIAEQYFADCPRASDSLVDEACTIIQWSGWRVVGSGGNPSAQALLYHQSGDIALQYIGLSDSDTLSATIGIQNDTSSSAAMLSCNRVAPTTQSVCFSLQSINNPPLAVADALTVDEGASQTLLDGGNLSVKDNDTDNEDGVPAGDVVLVAPPNVGMLALNPDGTLSYTHDGSESLSDSFSYTVADSDGAVSEPATVSIVINPVNDPPLAVKDSATGLRGSTISTLDSLAMSVRDNDSDAEDGIPGGAVTLVTPPGNGSLTLNLDGTFTYQHDDGPSTSDSFEYRVADSDGALSNIVSVTIVINTPPEDLVFSDGFESP